MTQLWWVNPETLQASPEALALFDAEELRQYQRFIPPVKRHEYLVTRVMMRTVLGQALGITPDEVRFVRNEWGRPELSPPSLIRFNISHTERLVVCLISRQYEVGVDTELLSRGPGVLALAPNVFAPKELIALRGLPVEEQEQRAVVLWTLKESYIKARGMGLSLSLRAFAFGFEEDRIHLEVEPSLQDDGARWQFKTRTLGPHIVSQAIQCPAAEVVDVEVIEFLYPKFVGSSL